MKKSDIAMIILIASLSIVIAFTVGSSLTFISPDEKGEKVDTIQPISAEVADPDPEVFNDKAINPTLRTVIGGSS